MTSEIPQRKHASSLSSDTSRRRRLITGQRLPWPVAARIIALLSVGLWVAIIWIVLRLIWG